MAYLRAKMIQAPPIQEAAEKLRAVVASDPSFIDIEVGDGTIFVLFSNRRSIRLFQKRMTFWYCYPVTTRFIRASKVEKQNAKQR